MNVRELRANLAAVLDRAAVGETVEITRDGVPVAVVGPLVQAAQKFAGPRSVGTNELGDSPVAARPRSILVGRDGDVLTMSADGPWEWRRPPGEVEP